MVVQLLRTLVIGDANVLATRLNFNNSTDGSAIYWNSGKLVIAKSMAVACTSNEVIENNNGKRKQIFILNGIKLVNAVFCELWRKVFDTISTIIMTIIIFIFSLSTFKMKCQTLNMANLQVMFICSIYCYKVVRMFFYNFNFKTVNNCS